MITGPSTTMRARVCEVYGSSTIGTRSCEFSVLTVVMKQVFNTYSGVWIRFQGGVVTYQKSSSSKIVTRFKSRVLNYRGNA